MTKVLRIEISANEISKIKNIQDIINISKKWFKSITKNAKKNPNKIAVISDQRKFHLKT